MSPSESDSNKTEKRRRLRWWPAAVIGIAALVALTWIWSAEVSNEAVRTIRTALVVIVSLLLLLLWWMLASGLSWKARGLGLAAVVLVGFLLRSLVAYDGVDGNLVPILRWSWTSRTVLDIPGTASGTHTATVAGAETDFPQFLGPNRDARLPGPRLSTDWTRHPPKQIWKQPIGLGWSSFAIAGELAVTQEQRGSQQLVVAYRLRSGEVVWVHTDEGPFQSALGGDGPRATPTISREGRVYTLGPGGLLNCLELESGKLLWQRNIETENAAGSMRWGRSSSPLLVDDLVVVNPGGSPHRSLAAYRQLSGEPVWTSGNAVTSYASPTLLTLLGKPQIVMVNQQMVTAHAPDDGRILWEQAFPSRQPHCSQPVAVADDLVLVSSGYGIGSKLFRISPGEKGKYRSETVWESRGLKTKFTNTVLHKDSIYGLDEGILVCLDPETGRRRWKRGRYGHGQLILVGDLLLITSEQGEVALVEANPERYQEVARFPALEGITWNTPALSGDLLLVRNHQQAAAYKLPVAQ
ncbi:MAG: PQQ-binding-like beta-propeller repeat protein [Acidobacteria bacterium]|nr:PQQ-binding-like beta-propeller repeat protein [Acidobacteriota bacterium]